MWRWTVLLYLLIFCGHTLSQPVADDTENARQARQLDFGECCPCPGAGQAEQGFEAQESSMFPGSGSFARARDPDDCPCRDQQSDSEGASSIFFPTSMRSDGPIVRPIDKKEGFKPLLYPEVDLASSVLQTLREATDEEYQDALARDAARSMAKAADETIFGNAVPEASDKIVTIILNPKQTDSLDDVIPQESHIQESRCIHAPLESVRTNLGKMRVAPKSPNLLRDVFGLPRINRPAGLLHRNLLDMDSGMGATNIQERVMHVDDDHVTNKSIQGLRKYAPMMKFDKNVHSESTNVKSNVGEDSSFNTVPDFKFPSMKNKLKDFISNRSSLEGKGIINSLPLIPKIKLSKAKGKNSEDLSLSPSNIQEQAKMNFFQTKSHLENILQKTRPVSLKNLLKLKDVELVPLKDLVHKVTERPIFNRSKFVLPAIFNKGDVISTNKNINPIKTKTTEIIETLPKTSKDDILDPEVSPSNVIEQITEDKCQNEAFKSTEINVKDTVNDLISTEIIDTASSPSDIKSTISHTSQDFANSQSNELADNSNDCNIKMFPATETNLTKSIESSFDDEIQENREGEQNLDTSLEDCTLNNANEEGPESKHVSNDEDCVGNIDDSDSITDSSNIINNVLEPNDTIVERPDDSEIKNVITEDSYFQELPANDNPTTFDSKPQAKLIKPLSLDETLSSIKENIIKRIESLKNPKTSSKIIKNGNSQTPSNIIENGEPSMISNEKLDSNCQNEKLIQVTTLKPDIFNDDFDSDNVSDTVSMHDLQKISDEMLQREEQDQKSKTVESSGPSQKVADPKIPIELNDGQNESVNFEQSANMQNEVIIDPQNFVDNDDKNENNIENNIESTCRSDVILPKHTFEQEPDGNAEASEIVIKSTPQRNDIIAPPLLLDKAVQPIEKVFNLLENPKPNVPDLLKLPPLPTLDEIKLSLHNSNETARDVEECSQSEADSMTDTSNILKPIMATDASTTNFQLRPPPLRLKEVNLDILKLKPQSSLIPKIPKIDLRHKTKLPLPTDFGFKPIELQSALKDMPVSRKNPRISDKPWETIPNFGNFEKTNTKKTAKSLRKPDILRNNLNPGLGLGAISDDIHSHAKNTLRSMQHALESRFKDATKNPIKLQNNDLLDAISRNHEDVNDKLRALHVDFNDRIETMRNNIFDKSIFGSNELRSTKSFSSFSTQRKDNKLPLKTSQSKLLTSRRESKKTMKPRRLGLQRATGIGSSQTLPNQKKFKMPGAASVPVPRTIEVPELKNTLTRSPGLAIQKASGVNTNIPNREDPQVKQSAVALWKQPNKNKRLGKPINPFKDSKIKVSFSTTPLPTIPPTLQSRKFSTPSSRSQTADIGTNTRRFGQRQDHNGSPSEVKHSIISPPISSHLEPHNLENYSVESERRRSSYDEPSWKSSGREKFEENVPPISKDLQFWPTVSESAILSKVKDAVKARLSNFNSPIQIKQSVSSSVAGNGEVLNSNTDMTRSASENFDIIGGQALKENVSYKCTMVCTKE